MTIFVFEWVENIVGKGENAGFSFSHSVFKRLLSQGREKWGLCGKELKEGCLCHFYDILDIIFDNWLKPFPNKPLFLRVCSKSLMKTLWEMKNLLVTDFLFFSQSVFHPFGKLSVIFINLKMSSAKSLSLEESKILSFGKGLNL